MAILTHQFTPGRAKGTVVLPGQRRKKPTLQDQDRKRVKGVCANCRKGRHANCFALTCECECHRRREP